MSRCTNNGWLLKAANKAPHLLPLAHPRHLLHLPRTILHLLRLRRHHLPVHLQEPPGTMQYVDIRPYLSNQNADGHFIGPPASRSLSLTSGVGVGTKMAKTAGGPSSLVPREPRQLSSTLSSVKCGLVRGRDCDFHPGEGSVYASTY